MTVADLAARIGATVAGDGSKIIRSANTLEEAGADQISFLSNPKYERQLKTTHAGAVIASPKVQSDRVTLLHTADPYYAFMQAVVLLHGYRRHPHAGVHPAAHVDATAIIGENSILYPGVFVGPRARIGRDCILYPNAVVYDDCVIGDRVTLHSCSVIGHDGFGYATHRGVHHKIPQVGNVIIEDDVEIGASVAIQRATIGSTVVGRGTKMSDLIGIGHAAKIGPDGLIVSLVGIAGSTRIGHHVVIGGQAGIVGHITLGDQVTIAAQAGVINDVPSKTTLVGSPAVATPRGRRVVTLIPQLPDLLERIRKLENEVLELRELGKSGPEPGEK